MKAQMHIGELAERVGVNAKTIRYYEDIDLLPAPARTQGGYRLYSADDAARLAFIRRARALNFSLGEIKEILDCRASGDAPCPYVLQLIQQKIATVEQRIAELQKLDKELRVLAREAARSGRQRMPRSAKICHILEVPRGKQSRRVRSPAR